MLRRLDYGDHDLIITFLTQSDGKISALAKAAKKSVKRFSGVLELFSILQIVYTTKKRDGPSFLKETSIIEPLDGIRSDVTKTAYSS